MNSTALITTMQRFVLATKKSWIGYDWASKTWHEFDR